jgi:catechol 2,3-dioxygenase-like lactoylglutathione lyase family enzyme
MRVQWTHLALHVHSLEASIAFYTRYTSLQVIDRHSDASSTGMEVVWLSDRSDDDELSFVLVLQEGTPTNAPGTKPQQPPGPISHLGFGLASRAEVDAVAEEAKKDGPAEIGSHVSEPVCRILVHHHRSGWAYSRILPWPILGKSCWALEISKIHPLTLSSVRRS